MAIIEMARLADESSTAATVVTIEMSFATLVSLSDASRQMVQWYYQFGVEVSRPYRRPRSSPEGFSVTSVSWWGAPSLPARDQVVAVMALMMMA